MRRFPSLFATAALLALGSGCASSGGMQYRPSSYRATLDTEFIAVVESQANVSGVRVTWVNPPRKAKKAPK